MKKLLIFVGVCCIFVGVYFGFIRKPPAGERVRILPGIEVVFTRDENAADYYAKACESLRRRSEGGEKPNSLTPEEREWFMLGTSCRRSSWYPEHYPHFTDPNEYAGPAEHLTNLAELTAHEGRSAERAGDFEKAVDIWKRLAVLGWHMDREKESAAQVLMGIALEAKACNEFVKHYGDRGYTREARRYEDLKERLRGRVKELLELTKLESAADYRRFKAMALSHKSPMWRKEACAGLAHYCINRDRSFQQDALTTLRKVAREDPDTLVKQTARKMIPYVLGQKPWLLPADAGARD